MPSTRETSSLRRGRDLIADEKPINGAAIGTRPRLLPAVLLVVIGTLFLGLGLLGALIAHGSNAPGLPAATGERLPLDPAIRDSLGLDADRLGGGAGGGAG